MKFCKYVPPSKVQSGEKPSPKGGREGTTVAAGARGEGGRPPTALLTRRHHQQQPSWKGVTSRQQKPGRSSCFRDTGVLQDRAAASEHLPRADNSLPLAPSRRKRLHRRQAQNLAVTASEPKPLQMSPLPPPPRSII